MWLIGTTLWRAYHVRAAPSGSGIRLVSRRFLGKVGAVDRGVEFAVAQHLEQVLVPACPLDAVGLAVFRHVAILERDPTHLAEVDTVFVLRVARPPTPRGL